jgi:hypothetical protein
MAGKHRALRRRLLWTLVATALAAAILSGCHKALDCPESDLAVDVTGGPGDVEACVLPADAANGRQLQVRNGSDVPITVWGSSTLLPWPVQPGQTVDISLFNPQAGDRVPFKPDLQAGVASAVLGWIGDQAPGGQSRSCAKQPDEHCVAGLAAELLPERVEIGHWTIPAKPIGMAVTTLWSHESLVRGFWGDVTGQEGTLTLRQA